MILTRGRGQDAWVTHFKEQPRHQKPLTLFNGFLMKRIRINVGKPMTKKAPEILKQRRQSELVRVCASFPSACRTAAP